MTDRPEPRPDEDRPSEFDWASPRWREADPPADDAERERRFRDSHAPRQRGAIDAGGSVPRSGEAPEDPGGSATG